MITLFLFAVVKVLSRIIEYIITWPGIRLKSLKTKTQVIDFPLQIRKKDTKET